ncbi:MAG: hypothetical protein GQ542_07130 [Desulforhopalus sp.]|nr:hypothetical protein [Desulforhopalus sp.]
MIHTKRNTLLILLRNATAYADIIHAADLPDLKISAFETVEGALSSADKANILL